MSIDIKKKCFVDKEIAFVNQHELNAINAIIVITRVDFLNVQYLRQGPTLCRVSTFTRLYTQLAPIPIDLGRLIG